MASNFATAPRRSVGHPTWLIPFIVLCVLAGSFGCLALLNQI
jgi:hypothetical protein